jgi:hypothetical protein
LVGLELFEEMAIWSNTHPHGNALQGFFNHTKTVLPSTEGTFCDSHANLSPFKQKSFLLDAKKTCSPRAPLNFRPTPWGHPWG